MKGFLSELARSVRWPWRAARMGLLLAAGLVVALRCVPFEDALIFYPDKYPAGWWEPPADPGREGPAPFAIEDVFFPAEGGLTLHGWYCTPKQGPALATVLWLHGNAGNLSGRYDMLRFLVALPARVFLIDYRGYGKSQGRPSEKGLYADARAAWDYLTKERGEPAGRIVVLGKSLGGAAAVDLASHVEPAGLIVQSSFTSVADMARRVFPWLPTFLIRTKMDSLSKIARVRAPKLFVHSPADEVVPYELGRRLFEAAAEPKRFVEVPGAGHNETYLAGGRAYWDAIRRFLLEVGA